MQSKGEYSLVGLAQRNPTFLLGSEYAMSGYAINHKVTYVPFTSLESGQRSGDYGQ